MPKKIVFEPATEIKVTGIIGFLKRKVTPSPRFEQKGFRPLSKQEGMISRLKQVAPEKSTDTFSNKLLRIIIQKRVRWDASKKLSKSTVSVTIKMSMRQIKNYIAKQEYLYLNIQAN